MQKLLIGLGAAALLATSSLPASALTMQECSTKYQAAKKANTLKGMKWNDFRKSECGDDDADESSAAAAVKEDPAPPRAAPAAKAGAPAAAPAAAATATAPKGRMVYPRAVDPKFASETPGKARLHTCAQQYNANKASNANGGLRWIEAGGGYWSLCNKRLKGA